MMNTKTLRHAGIVLATFAAALLSACASTTLTDSWSDSSYTRGPFQKWIVVGVGGGPVAVRTLEDVMTNKLRARGVEAVQGYRYLPDGQASEAQLDGAVAAAGAQAMMLVHLRRVETKTQVNTTLVPGPMYPGFGWYGVYGSSTRWQRSRPPCTRSPRSGWCGRASRRRSIPAAWRPRRRAFPT
jgi:hypothetical protein